VFLYAVKATPFASNPLFVAVHGAFRTAHPLLLAAIGAAASWSRRLTEGVPPHALPVLRMAGLLLVFLYLVHVPFPTCSRFQVPVLPAFHLAAVFAIVAVYRAIRRRTG
jgi:hypothetical protein